MFVQKKLFVGLMLLGLGCSSAEIRRFDKTLGEFGKTGNTNQLIRRGINWTVQNFSSSALGTGIPIRESNTGPIRGRWFLNQLQFLEQPDATLIGTLSGEGYYHDSMAQVVTFRTKATVKYRTDLQTQGDMAYVTFRSLEIKDLEFDGLRVTGFWASILSGVTFQLAKDKMRERLGRGFTVAMNTKLEKQTYLGIGLPAELPPAPWTAPIGSEVLMNDRVTICEDGRHFLGPFHVRLGEVLQLTVKTEQDWGMDSYLLHNAEARALLGVYIDPSKPAQKSYSVIASGEGLKKWEYSWKATFETSVWVMIDNGDTGKAVPPRNMKNDEITVDAYVGKPR